MQELNITMIAVAVLFVLVAIWYNWPTRNLKRQELKMANQNGPIVIEPTTFTTQELYILREAVVKMWPKPDDTSNPQLVAGVIAKLNAKLAAVGRA